MYDEFIARILLFSDTIVPSYESYLRRIKFRDRLVNNIIEKILESWEVFNEVKIEFLREKFKDREDINLFMRKASEIELSGDASFNKYWVGNFMSQSVLDEIRNSDYDADKVRDLSVLASELKNVAEGKITPVRVWDVSSDKKVDERIDFYQAEKEKVLKIGISLFDEQIEMSNGTVTIFMAPFKRYKSITLTNVGAVALAQGYSVFQVHYEGKQKLWEKRYDSCISGIPYNRLYKDLNEKEKNLLKKVYRNVKGKVYFMKATPKKVGYPEIKNELEKLKKEGIFFDVVIVDYLNLMRPSKKYGDDWIEQGDLAWDLVTLSQEGYIVVSAAQSKMGSVSKEVLGPDDLGRSAVIVQATDNLIALNQNRTEYAGGLLRMNPLVMRYDKVSAQEIRLVMRLFKMRLSDEMDSMFEHLVSD